MNIVRFYSSWIACLFDIPDLGFSDFTFIGRGRLKSEVLTGPDFPN